MNIFLYMVSIKFEILELLRILLYKAECNVMKHFVSPKCD